MSAKCQRADLGGEGNERTNDDQGIQLLIVAEDAQLVEWNAPVGREVGLDSWPPRHPIMERDQSWRSFSKRFICLGKA